MNKSLQQMVLEIKRASQREKLVVFIGAGVSVNSGYKLWDNLISLFNEEQKYSPKKSGFNNDEMLKIPQYYFNENQDEYFNILKNEYGREIENTNEIIDEILKLNPVHIITTNFDLLIEKSIKNNCVYGNTIYDSLEKYFVIRSDDDFACADKNNYLIKMHGDVKSFENIVLKEEDYLNFSSTHILIETFIKSLFVNHTILFIGYGLGDYNIKLIMSWVNRVLKNHSGYKDQNRVEYYFMNAGEKALNKYEKEYYKKQNINILEYKEIPSVFEVPDYDNRSTVFSNSKGNNLLKLCQFVQFGMSGDINEIIRDLSKFDNVACITINELMESLGDYSKKYEIYNNKLFYDKNIISPVMMSIFDTLINKTSNFEILNSIFHKAGIKAIIDKKDKNYINLPEIDSYDATIYNAVIECNIIKLRELSQMPSSCARLFLQSGYLFSLLDNKGKAIVFLEKAVLEYENNHDVFHLLICQQNLSKLYNKDVEDWYLLIKNLSSEDKKNYYTLFNYLNNSNEIYSYTIEVFKDIEKRFDVNCNSTCSDIDTTIFLELRYQIQQVQKYFIENNIFIRGFSNFDRIIGKWLKSLDIYVELLFLIHSSNMKSNRGKIKYRRNKLNKEDIYILITHSNNDNLKFFIKKYNVNILETLDDVPNYVITVLSNFIDAFEDEKNFESIISFRFANQIKNIFTLIPYIRFDENKYEETFKCISKLLYKIFVTHFENTDYFFHVFRSVIIEIEECISKILKNEKHLIKDIWVKKLIEDVLVTYTSNSSKENLGIFIFKECGILLFFSEILSFYFNDKISECVANDFLLRIQNENKNCLYKFIIELFPILSITQMKKWKTEINIENMESVYIRFAIINGVFEYNKEVENRLVVLCRKQLIGKFADKTPLCSVLRLVEADKIPNLKAFETFIGYYDFFDFVCFPNNFDYSKFDISWSDWLNLEKYRIPALKKFYDILKEKYEKALEDGASDMEKAIYYKYFY